MVTVRWLVVSVWAFGVVVWMLWRPSRWVEWAPGERAALLGALFVLWSLVFVAGW